MSVMPVVLAARVDRIGDECAATVLARQLNRLVHQPRADASPPKQRVHRHARLSDVSVLVFFGS